MFLPESSIDDMEAIRLREEGQNLADRYMCLEKFFSSFIEQLDCLSLFLVFIIYAIVCSVLLLMFA